MTHRCNEQSIRATFEKVVKGLCDRREDVPCTLRWMIAGHREGDSGAAGDNPPLEAKDDRSPL